MSDIVSSPGLMDLGALGGLKKRRTAAPAAPAEDAPGTAQAETPDVVDSVDQDSSASTADEPETAAPPAPAVPSVPAAAPAAPAVTIRPAEEEHSGHVTLYLPRDLNQWLAHHHDLTGVSYPGIVLNAISWAAAENRFAQIFAPEDSPIPANDIFGRAPVIARPARSTAEPETRPVRFRRDHMKVIISLARTWTADNRNAFFTGVLSAYRDGQQTAGTDTGAVTETAGSAGTSTS